MVNKRTILIDLDGVLNTYTGKYDENRIPPIKDGACEFLSELSKEYRVVVFTSRNLFLVSKWIIDNNLSEYVSNITNVKEPSYLIIDDRCITFDGNYDELKKCIDNFMVWHKK